MIGYFKPETGGQGPVFQQHDKTELGLVWGEPTLGVPKPIIGSHASSKAVVFQGVDGQEVLREMTRESGVFYLRLSNPQYTPIDIVLNVAALMPDDTGLAHEMMPGEPLQGTFSIPPRRTIDVSLPFSLSKAMWDKLVARTIGFGMGTIGFEVSASDSEGEAVMPWRSGNQVGPMVETTVSYIPYAPERSAPLPPPQATVRQHEGVPMLVVNSRYEPSNFAYIAWNWGTVPSTVHDFSTQGRHLYRIVFQPWSLWHNGQLDPERFERRMNEIVSSIVGNDPQALIYVFWWLHTPKDWPDYFPGQTIIYDDGTDHTPHPSGDQEGWPRPSLSSKVWLEQQDLIMREAASRILSSAYADRVFGVSVGYGNGGEWNGYGYHGGRFGDFSEPSAHDFQTWLQGRYGSLSALNAAWGTSYADWQDIKIPDRDSRLTSGWGSFTGPDYPVSVTDYYRFVTWRTTELIEHFARLFKEESKGKWLVGFFYGYFASHLAAAPYHSLDSGHFGLGRLLKSDAIDFFAYPYGYHDRRRGMALGNAIGSVQAAGKLYVVECDLPTHLNDQSKTPVMAHHEGGVYDAASAVTSYWRDFSRICTGGLAGWWYDFGRGWYTFPEWGEFVSRVESVREWQRSHSQASVAEVAVILDEHSVFFTGPQSSGYGQSLYQTLAYEMDESGAAWEAFLATDIEEVLKGKYKVIILLNPVSDADELAEKLAGTSATLVWGYGAGLVDGSNWTSTPRVGRSGPEYEVEAGKTVGAITLQNKGHTESLPAPLDGILPRICVTDGQSSVVARYRDGAVAVASTLRQTDNGPITDYWLGTPQLTRPLLSLIYDEAGVHRYTRDGTSSFANATSVSVWRQMGGDATVSLPRKAARIVDAWSGELVGQDTDIFSVVGIEGRSTAGLYLIEW